MFHGCGIEVIQIDIYYNAPLPELLRNEGRNYVFLQNPHRQIAVKKKIPTHSSGSSSASLRCLKPIRFRGIDD